MAKAALLAAALITSSIAQGSAAELVGTAVQSINDVTATLDAMTRAIASGDGLSANEVVKTGAESTTQISFLDDTKLTIGASSVVVLDRFLYDSEGRADDAVFNFSKGAFRFITGKSDPSKFEIHTQVATLGIRGTDFVVICDGKQRCAVVVTKGLVKICPLPDQPPDCKVAFQLDTKKNAAMIEANGQTTGPRSISRSLVAAITGAVATGRELTPAVVAIGWEKQGPPQTPRPLNASPG